MGLGVDTGAMAAAVDEVGLGLGVALVLGVADGKGRGSVRVAFSMAVTAAPESTKVRDAAHSDLE